MHGDQDIEKGTSEMVETSDEKGNLERSTPAAPIALSRSPSPRQATTSTPIPLHALRSATSVNFADDTLSTDDSHSGMDNSKSPDVSRAA